MWRRKHKVRIAHRQKIVSHGDEIDDDNKDVAETMTSLAIRPAMAERDRKKDRSRCGRRQPERSEG